MNLTIQSMPVKMTAMPIHMAKSILNKIENAIVMPIAQAANEISSPMNCTLPHVAACLQGHR